MARYLRKMNGRMDRAIYAVPRSLKCRNWERKELKLQSKRKEVTFIAATYTTITINT